MKRPVVGITLGDPCGIGPEIIAKALQSRRVQRALIPRVFGNLESLAPADRRPGKPTRAGALLSFKFLQDAIGAGKRGDIDALCTAPVSKEAISRAGIPFVGHTEVLAEAFDAQVLMLMDGPKLKVALATQHLPLKDVSKSITRASLSWQLRLLDSCLTVGKRRPRIAVCGLNPHAGDGGILGKEEVRTIAPAIAKARREGIRAEGPFPADGLFAKAAHFPFDVALAMFHDQGLVATKTFDFRRTVNVTLGLPFVRTSPDHGVAYDIAGKGVADPEPMIQALLRASSTCFSGRSSAFIR